MTSSPLRVGILGASFGATVHAPAFNYHPGFELMAIASPNNAERVASERNIPRHFSSCEAMLDAVELDVLAIAAPPTHHYAAARAALERGLHVLCEKPFTHSVAQALELVGLAEKAHRVGALAHEFRFLPARQAMYELLANDHLGALRQIEIVKMSDFLRLENTPPNSWWFSREAGGGITGARMSHAIDMACFLAGRAPQAVHGFGRTANAKRRDAQGLEFSSDVEDGVFALLDFGTGLIARLTVDGTSAITSFICGLHGEERTAIASGTSMFNERMFTVDGDESAELQLRELPARKLAASNELLPAFVEMLDAFLARIEGRPSHIATFADGLITQRVLAAIGYGD